MMAGGGGKADLLASIKAGKSLKPVDQAPPPPAPAGGGMNDLLSAIKQGSKLKKVERVAAPVAAPASTLGAFANPGISSILERRKYLEADDSESDSDSDDSEDWD